jgi:hypothetical protein
VHNGQEKEQFMLAAMTAQLELELGEHTNPSKRSGQQKKQKGMNG